METTLANLKTVFKYDKINNELWFYHQDDPGLGGGTNPFLFGELNTRDELHRSEELPIGSLNNDITPPYNNTNHLDHVELVLYDASNNEIYRENLTHLEETDNKLNEEDPPLYLLEKIPYSDSRDDDFVKFNEINSIENRIVLPGPIKIIRKIKNFDYNVYQNISSAKIIKHYVNPHIVGNDVIEWISSDNRLQSGNDKSIITTSGEDENNNSFNRSYITVYVPEYFFKENVKNDFIFTLKKSSSTLDNRFDTENLIKAATIIGGDLLPYTGNSIYAGHYNAKVREAPSNYDLLNNPYTYIHSIGYKAKGYLIILQIGLPKDIYAGMNIEETYRIGFLKEVPYPNASQFFEQVIGEFTYKINIDLNYTGNYFWTESSNNHPILNSVNEMYFFLLAGEMPFIHRKIIKNIFKPGTPNLSPGNPAFVSPQWINTESEDSLTADMLITNAPYYNNKIFTNNFPSFEEALESFNTEAFNYNVLITDSLSTLMNKSIKYLKIEDMNDVEYSNANYFNYFSNNSTNLDQISVKYEINIYTNKGPEKGLYSPTSKILYIFRFEVYSTVDPNSIDFNNGTFTENNILAGAYRY